MPVRSELPPYNQSIAAALLRARESVMTPVRQVLRSRDITEQQWRVMRVLQEMGPLETTRVAVEALILGPSATRILRDLVRRKMIIRSNTPSDGRRFIFSLTAQGRSILHELDRPLSDAIKQIHDAFDKNRLDSLIMELQALARSLDAVTDRQLSR